MRNYLRFKTKSFFFDKKKIVVETFNKFHEIFEGILKTLRENIEQIMKIFKKIFRKLDGRNFREF